MSSIVPPTTITPERLAEIKDLLKYESSIAFYSHRAKESLLLLVSDYERQTAELEQITGNARKLVDGWLKASGEHFSVSRIAELKATPHLAGIQAGRADQYSDCANELRDVLDGEDPDDWDHGVSISATPAEGGAR